MSITTTTLDDLTNASLIEPVLIAALSESPGIAMRNCREFSLVGKATNVARIPTETAYWGSANDDGAGIDLEFNATEATALSNTVVNSGSVTITAAEYGVAHALMDNVSEDSVDGIELMTLFTSRMLHVLGLAMDDDYLALYASLSQVVGSTGVDLTAAQMIAAQTGLRVRGVQADSIAYVLDNQQVSDLEGVLSAATSSVATFALAADRLINYAPTANNGLDASRQVMTFRGAPVFSTGLTDTANAAADVVGACICPTTQFNDNSGATTHGMAWKRLPRFETQRQAKLRATDLVMTARAGFGELQDGAGSAIITDA